ncbi:MAG: hypothetical protein A2946_00420 [Candidatus Liptonbacteria bacterium RIFCSPLOWO2_01_FULL_53_13]|uniref:Delta(24)-sterol reductase n=1 Tax=Candidatus Liptonbacteria bacterium RIFCSPLOWO2_01_FULL_53_13 TaxID=1798651 RepID=A0A1G2CGE1_9BACT|nr:MAG: hypothetical protein A2946_00420 [Candidatus Liptonbacteria bacterium RIFCSPLOWO2_01_FULL_53_13]
MTKQETHTLDVSNVCRQVKEAYRQKNKLSVYHGTTNSTRSLRFKTGEFVDISKLNRILAISEKERYALVEPNVPMDKLLRATLKAGLMPAVVPEFPGITLGGGIQGGAGESSSFKYGGVHNGCEEYEMVLGNGELVKASANENADLYWGTACSYGTLGIITLAKLHLLPAKRYVRLAYRTVRGAEEAVALLAASARKDFDYIDGILFSKNFGVVMTGKLTDDNQNLPIATFHKATDEWFYLHAESFSQRHPNGEECIPLVDYLFRYDRGAFWAGKYAFRRANVPFNRVTRFLLNPFFKTRTMYRLLHTTNASQQYVSQDICFPQKTTLQFIRFVDETLNIYPLWLLPIKPALHEKLAPSWLQDNLAINVGVWSESTRDADKFISLNRTMEAVAKNLGGRKTLYAHAYYTREEFWKIYDLGWYEALRKKYYATDVFPDIYEKTNVSRKYTPSLRKGLWDFIKSPFKIPIDASKPE